MSKEQYDNYSHDDQFGLLNVDNYKEDVNTLTYNLRLKLEAMYDETFCMALKPDVIDGLEVKAFQEYCEQNKTTLDKNKQITIEAEHSFGPKDLNYVSDCKKYLDDFQNKSMALDLMASTKIINIENDITINNIVKRHLHRIGTLAEFGQLWHELVDQEFEGEQFDQEIYTELINQHSETLTLKEKIINNTYPTDPATFYIDFTQDILINDIYQNNEKLYDDFAKSQILKLSFYINLYDNDQYLNNSNKEYLKNKALPIIDSLDIENGKKENIIKLFFS